MNFTLHPAPDARPLIIDVTEITDEQRNRWMRGESHEDDDPVAYAEWSASEEGRSALAAIDAKRDAAIVKAIAEERAERVRHGLSPSRTHAENLALLDQHCRELGPAHGPRLRRKLQNQRWQRGLARGVDRPQRFAIACRHEWRAAPRQRARARRRTTRRALARSGPSSSSDGSDGPPRSRRAARGGAL